MPGTNGTNDMQPGILPDGLFGPDAFIPDWGRPGYNPPPDITSPGGRFGHVGPGGGPQPEMMGLLSGLDPIAPFPIPIPDLPDFGELDLPDIAPSQNLPDFGIIVLSYDEVMEEHYGHFRPVSRFTHPFLINIAPPPGKTTAPKIGDPHPTIPGLRYAGGGSYESAPSGSQIHVGSGGAGKKVYRNSRGVETRHRKTGRYSYKEEIGELPEGDLGAYFESQRQEALSEGRGIIVDFLLDCVFYSSLGVAATRILSGLLMAEAIIGESMGRVREYVYRHGGIYFEGGGLKGKPLKYANRLWVQFNKLLGRKFKDIGPDVYRRFHLKEPPSTFYEMERRLLRHYWNYWIDFVD